MQLNSAKDLDVYKKSYQLALTIFNMSKSFPLDEKFALTSQIKFFAPRLRQRTDQPLAEPSPQRETSRQIAASSMQ